MVLGLNESQVNALHYIQIICIFTIQLLVTGYIFCEINVAHVDIDNIAWKISGWVLWEMHVIPYPNCIQKV